MSRSWVIGGAGLLGQRLPGLSIDLQEPCDYQADACDSTMLARIIEQEGYPELIFIATSTRGGDAEAYRHCYLDLLNSLPDAKLVFCSSSSLCADGSESPRAAIMREAEQIVLSRGGCVARLAPLYSEHRCALVSRFLAGQAPLHGDDARWIHYSHVDDAAAALILLADAPSAIYSVVAESWRKGEILQLLSDWSALPIPQGEARVSCRIVSNCELNSDALRTLGWNPQRSIKELISR